MPQPAPAHERVRVDGRFFRTDSQRFIVRGVTYGTFAPNSAGEPFPEPDAARRDLEQMRQLGANVFRTYDLPPHWLLDTAASLGLRAFITAPWAYQSCFLASATSRRNARTAVATTACSLARHPAVFALAVANEIPPDIIRWSHPSRVAAFIDELIDAAHDADPDLLCTYANFPPTEFLQPRRHDFVTFNVFLHQRSTLDPYLARLQLLAGDLPLVLGECGADARREGPDSQARILADNLAAARDAGLAGAVVFAFTDDWVRGGLRVQDWEMGLTTANRQPRPAFAAVQAAFLAPTHPASPTPRVTVVVACYNGAQTLRACLESLRRLDYPDFEILVIDDGSTDHTPDITTAFPDVRTLRHPENRGLSTARNLGIRAASGEVVAFTDADCEADRDWLRHLVAALTRGDAVAAGGPNLLPPDDSTVAAAVMASPGGPTHVMLDDRSAEHVPGCNMAFRKSALEQIGGFDPTFRRAGDDVDICWRIQARGWRIAFAPAAFVWHHRRATVGDYLRQQAGYGEAEALLATRHPDRFNALGNAVWHGRIVGPPADPPPWRHPVIHHGPFATGLFQTVYTPRPGSLLPFLTSLEYHLAIALPLLILAVFLPPIGPLALASWLLPPALATFAASRTVLPPNRTSPTSRPLVALLHYLQPLVRAAARYGARMRLGNSLPHPTSTSTRTTTTTSTSATTDPDRAFWSPTWRERTDWIQRIRQTLDQHQWPNQPDTGWSRHDLALLGSSWIRLEFVTAAEANHDHSQTLRSRTRTRWTLAAHTAFWALLATQALAFGAFDLPIRLAWLPALPQLALAATLVHRGRCLRRRFNALLDEVAHDWNLTPANAQPATPPHGTPTSAA